MPQKSKPSKFLPVSVAVLMGGDSKRFGSAKAYLPYKGKTLAAHVLGQAAHCSKEVFAVSRWKDQVPPDARRKFRVVTDRWGQEGPLAGLHAALLGSTRPAVFLTAVDMPFLSGKVIAGFWSLFEKEGGPDVVIPRIQGRWEPLCALWNHRLVTKLQTKKWESFQTLLNEGNLRIRRVGKTEMKKLDASLNCLKNINHPREWKKLIRPSLSH